MGVGGGGGGAGATEDFGKRRIAAERRAQRERVGQEAHERFEAGMGAVSDRGADGKIRLARVAEQKTGPPREQHLEERGPLAASDVAQRAGEVGRKCKIFCRSRVGHRGRAGMIGRQVEDGCVGQRALPKSQTFCRRGSGQSLGLPRNIIGKLHGHLGQFGCTARGLSAVECGEVAHDYARRPTVGDEVVDRENKHGLAGLSHE